MAFPTFGYGAVQSAYISYIRLDISANSITLIWPNTYVDTVATPQGTPNTLAAYMDVTNVIGNTYTITLPDATQASVGQNFIMTNGGARAFNVLKSDGTVLFTAATTLNANSYYVILKDNTTSAGDWTIIAFGVGSSTADPTALAGLGLKAITTTLNTNIPVFTVNTPPVLDATYRASLIVWTGGVGTITLPLIVNSPQGYYLSFTNVGSAAITIQTSDGKTIGGNSSILVELSQSLTIISDGNNWQTLGFGQQQFPVTTVNKQTIGATTSVYLSPQQASSLIQEYLGTLTGNTTVFFPVVANDWIISNKTDPGPYTLSVQLGTSGGGPVGTAYIVPPASTAPAITTQQYVSDATTIFPSQTSLQLINGTVAYPSIAFGNTSFNAPGLSLGTFGGQSTLVYSVGGSLVSRTGYDASNNFTIFNLTSISGTNNLYMGVNDTQANLWYPNETTPTISISLTGVVTFPQAPLPIGSGGTDAITQPLALNNLMPTATAGAGALIYYNGTNWVPVSNTPAPAAGTIVYYNGTNWINLPVGTTDGQVLTVVSAGVLGWA
ncbi:MAG TPA: hypothetical protein VNZ45_12655 [Bacteroidia bacterium]|jgi:hypothetical protein|nr:hypothetical protein [Bacteroidia bacterium]